MNNYKLIIQYDGTNYSGWQIQTNAPTIQQTITDSIEMITKEKVNLIGSGRTDSGVHALGQVANFQSGKISDISKFRYSLNAVLPADISITGMHKVPESFHSRFDAVKRSYLYLFTKIKSPFYDKYSCPLNRYGMVDLKKLKQISGLFLGKKDFTSFARKKTETENKICNIFSILWRENPEFLWFIIEADRFLHGMVRTVGGTILDALSTADPENYISGIFAAKNREFAGKALPAKGLFLLKVRYNNDRFER